MVENNEESFAFYAGSPNDGKSCHQLVAQYVRAGIGAHPTLRARLQDKLPDHPNVGANRSGFWAIQGPICGGA